MKNMYIILILVIIFIYIINHKIINNILNHLFNSNNNYTIFDQINIFILNIIIVLRGILSPNCFWWSISDLLLKDGSGINLFNKFKQKQGDFPITYQYNKKIYLVTNVKHIKIILDNSPNIFSVGQLKNKYFNSFMSLNVGVSSGCPWKYRRLLNEKVLETDKLHRYSKKYNNYTFNILKNIHTNIFDFSIFTEIGKKMVSKIIFNENRIPDYIFTIFSQADSVYNLYAKDFSIDPILKYKYYNYLKKHIQNPNNHSLVKLCVENIKNIKKCPFNQTQNSETEILHQIPHFIFPMIGLYNSTIPQILLFLFNHKYILKKVINEIKNLNNNNSYELTYLRKCIMETLRLNNLVVTTFRTLLQDYEFDNKYKFKKGDQFLILNSPILRQKDFFSEPNKFIPERWTEEIEKSYYAISFNQGPQKCPAKELAINLCQSFILNFFRIYGILDNPEKLKTKKINTDNVPQVINRCKIRIHIK